LIFCEFETGGILFLSKLPAVQPHLPFHIDQKVAELIQALGDNAAGFRLHPARFDHLFKLLDPALVLFCLLFQHAGGFERIARSG
jgi:hypothetical protein